MGTINKQLRIFVDPGEAYGNIGDEMMLLNALRRLEHYLGPCEFIMPAQDGKPLPDLPENVRLIPHPYLAFQFWSRPGWLVVNIGRNIPVLRRWFKSPNASLPWRWSAGILNILLLLYRSHLLPYPSKVLKTFADAMRSCDAFYGVGAAGLNDYNLPGVIYKCWLYKMVRSWVKVSAVSAQGIGPLETPWAGKWLKQAFESLDLLSFRDCSFSYNFVSRLNPKHVRYNVVADESFSFPSTDRNEAIAFLRGSGLEPTASFIAFHFRTKDYTQNTTHLIPTIASILDAVCKVVPHLIVFFPMSYHTHSTFDEVGGLAIQAAMKNPKRMIIAPLCKNPALLKGAIGLARYSMGVSYHVHVASLQQGHPALILYSGEYYRYKSEGLVGFYGPPNAALDVQRTSLEDIINAVKDIERNYENACIAIRKTNKDISKKNDWTIREMARMLRGNSLLFANRAAEGR